MWFEIKLPNVDTQTGCMCLCILDFVFSFERFVMAYSSATKVVVISNCLASSAVRASLIRNFKDLSMSRRLIAFVEQ